MPELLTALGPALLGGIALGALYAVSLWYGVRLVTARERGLPWLLLGGAVRVLLVAGGIFLLADGDWRRALACVAGFLLVRVVAVHLARAGLPALARRG